MTDSSRERLRPRALVHRGRVAAAGFVFDLGLMPLGEARRRLLALWVPGARAFRLPDGLLLTLPKPVPVRAEDASGLPLVERGGVLYAAPLTPAEAKALSAPGGSVVLVRGGAAVVEALADLPAEDPAAYLDLGPADAAPVKAVSLGEPPAPARATDAGPPPFDARKQFKDVPPPSEQMNDVLRAIRDAAGRPRPNATPPGANGGLGQGGLLADIARKLLRGLGIEGSGGAANTGTGQGSGGRDRAAQFREWSEALGRQQAEYIGKMLEMFERGNLDDALRHAIPLSSLTNPTNEDLPPAAGVPTPRPDLSFGPQEKRADSAFGFGGEFFVDLRRLYRQAFERLEAQGRIDEAAFVLAELLRANEEAVAFLERHGRLRLAAEMAEARGLPPGLVVRLWFLAGDHERAVLIARRTGAFADAVARLERGDSRQREQAKSLRMLWAAELARAGDYPAAIEVAWPVEEARALALGWMDRVIELGGPPAARMRVRRLAAPASATELKQMREAILDLLDADAPESARDRAALAEELARLNLPAESPALPTLRVLARAAARTLARDVAHAEQGGGPPDPGTVGRLVLASADGVLRADSVTVAPPPLPALRSRTAPREVRVESGDVGTLPVYDAALLPDGRCLVALGEAGVLLVASDGRTVAHWPQPAHGLILADSGTRALTVAPRGEATRLGRLDLATRRCEDWCEALITAAAPDYDGSLWFVQSGDALLAVDASAKGSGLFALSRLPDLGGRVLSLARSPRHCALVLENTAQEAARQLPVVHPDRWLFDLPSLNLRSRSVVHLPLPPATAAYRVSPVGTLVQQIAAPVGFGDFPEQEVTLTCGSAVFELGRLPHGAVAPFQVTDDWAAVAVPSFAESVCHLLDVREMRPRAVVTLGGAGAVVLRFAYDHLTLADDRGRVIALHLGTGAVRLNVRVT